MATYPHTLTGAQGGDGPYTWSLEKSGSLPAGLSLSRDGVITGTPTEAGVWIFNVMVNADGFEPGRGVVVIGVNAPPSP